LRSRRSEKGVVEVEAERRTHGPHSAAGTFDLVPSALLAQHVDQRIVGAVFVDPLTHKRFV
jgi:hypothetical protein